MEHDESDAKVLLVLDNGTEIPALAVRSAVDSPVWKRAGYSRSQYVLLVDLNTNFATTDPNRWPDAYGRTMRVAHQMLLADWSGFTSSVDVGRHQPQNPRLHLV